MNTCYLSDLTEGWVFDLLEDRLEPIDGFKEMFWDGRSKTLRTSIDGRNALESWFLHFNELPGQCGVIVCSDLPLSNAGAAIEIANTVAKAMGYTTIMISQIARKRLLQPWINDGFTIVSRNRNAHSGRHIVILTKNLDYRDVLSTAIDYGEA